jgi:hypothetical protein
MLADYSSYIHHPGSDDAPSFVTCIALSFVTCIALFCVTCSGGSDSEFLGDTTSIAMGKIYDPDYFFECIEYLPCIVTIKMLLRVIKINK